MLIHCHGQLFSMNTQQVLWITVNQSPKILKWAMNTTVKLKMQVIWNGIIVLVVIQYVQAIIRFVIIALVQIYLTTKVESFLCSKCLLGLFKKYQKCVNAESTTTTTNTIETFASVTHTCSTCLSTFQRDSQLMIKQAPAGNLFSAAVLFSGSLPANVFKFFQIFGCTTISRNTFSVTRASSPMCIWWCLER